MHRFNLDDLFKSAAGDGASLPSRAEPAELELDYEDLLAAWSIERGQSIECEILLRLSRAAIRRLLGEDGDLPDSTRIETSDLIDQINAQLKQRRPYET